MQIRAEKQAPREINKLLRARSKKRKSSEKWWCLLLQPLTLLTFGLLLIAG